MNPEAEEAKALDAQRKIVARIGQLDEERANLVQEALRLDGEIRIMRRLQGKPEKEG